jgi:hypothetical protein
MTGLFILLTSSKKVKTMETTIKINTDALTPEFIEGIKKLFPHKTVEINIQETDTTDYILSNPNYDKVLQERIEKYNLKKEVINLKADELL